ncbi:hypothetical protein AQUCO_03500134v1 [Aquilegia coerulea]|uniref:Exostosin GT47 domain-containing protein n=1 Tax=Aquilegia coerulea TaxID=218851 RepID=A0A2G5CWC2_AQUCA|nr:hypothetical protein AQUCO_03500134v1 [Aquilegia coerulea]
MNWRKLVCVVVIMTAVGVVLQTYVPPYPINNWFLVPPVIVSLPEVSNSTYFVKETIPTVSFPSVVTKNSSNVASEIIPLVPVLEVRAEVSSRIGRGRRGRGRGNMNTNKKNPNEPKVVPQPPPKLVVPGQSPIWSLPSDKTLLYAKKELEHAPIVADDPDLYAPLFRNVSIFKRSYELMESILKVGIYASEGWFLKLMEENRQFVTRDPKRAHLFYLPYSARQLQLALYVPDSHNLKPLSIFLRDHVNMIAAKYPFWNRTRGADRFLVACHDWGPYTMTEHEELLRNTLKALCNADLSELIFVPGRDVSLPETTIRRPRKPLRGIGGKRVSQRPILAFFAGNMHGRVRPALLQYWDGKDEDMRIYGHLPNRVARVMSYAVHMKLSRFCICPMGYEVNSPRILKAIYNECVPVIIADNFVLPFSQVLDWKSFSVVVAEKDIPNLKVILLAIPLRRYLWMQTNVKIPIRYDLFHMVLHSIWFNRLNQIQIQQQ